MPTFNVQETKFTLSVLPLKFLSKGFWARTELVVENEFVSYHEKGEYFSREELDEWICCMFRLLAGAYGKEYTIRFEKAGFAVDLYPHTENGEEVSREKRRQNDCVMAIRLLMRSKEKGFLGGVYTLLLHRKEIEEFACALREEFDAVFDARKPKKGKYLFVGVSPKGYKGCNYWYLDPTKSVGAGDYVWVCMGRHNLKQIVYVDSVHWCSDDTAPYDPETVKRVLKKATDSER